MRKKQKAKLVAEMILEGRKKRWFDGVSLFFAGLALGVVLNEGFTHLREGVMNVDSSQHYKKMEKKPETLKL